MSGHGETPEAEGEPDVGADDLQLGERVYNGDGEYLGQIRGVEEAGFFVTIREGAEGMSIEHARSGHEFGEAELMWRCTECGQMGRIDDGLPEWCPNCETERENLEYWVED